MMDDASPPRPWLRLAFKHEDTARLALLTALLIVVIAAVAALVSWQAAVLGGLVAAFGGVVALQLHLHRRMQAELVAHQENVQALLHLFALLPPPRAPLSPLTGWAASPQLAVALHTLVAAKRPSTVIELGSGTSTIVVAYALQQLGGGRVISLDHDAAYAAQTHAELQRHGLGDYATVVHAPLIAVTLDDQRTWTWYDTTALPSFDRADLILVDGPPVQTQPLARYPALPLLRAHLGPGTTVVLDDAQRTSEQQVVARWLDAFPSFEVQYLPAGRKRLAQLDWPDRPAS